MADDPTEEMINKAIERARKAVRNDRFTSHSRTVDDRLSRIEQGLSGKSGDSGKPNDEVDDRDGKTDPPPKKDPPNDPERTQRKSLWWGDKIQ